LYCFSRLGARDRWVDFFLNMSPSRTRAQSPVEPCGTIAGELTLRWNIELGNLRGFPVIGHGAVDSFAAEGSRCLRIRNQPRQCGSAATRPATETQRYSLPVACGPVRNSENTIAHNVRPLTQIQFEPSRRSSTAGGNTSQPLGRSTSTFHSAVSRWPREGGI
jgi:hypothetical protein